MNTSNGRRSTFSIARATVADMAPTGGGRSLLCGRLPNMINYPEGIQAVQDGSPCRRGQRHGFPSQVVRGLSSASCCLRLPFLAGLGNFPLFMNVMLIDPSCEQPDPLISCPYMFILISALRH